MASRMHAFGVELVGSERLANVPAGRAPVGGRRTTFQLRDRERLAAQWPPHGAVRLIEEHRPDGTLFIAVDRHPTAGYRIDAPEYGEHVVTAAGDRWLGAPAAGPAWHWQKLVFAQVLPTVATLQGVEVLHAGAVAVDGRVYGLLGPSGAGKSSTAAHLIARGARFFSDDVLAVEERAGRVVAHPGPQFANLHAHDLDALQPSARARLGEPLGESDKCHLRPRGVSGPLPLGGLFFLARARDGAAVDVEPVARGARLLLAAAFAPHVATSRRLQTQLATCAAVERDVPLWRLTAGPASGAGAVAAAVWSHIPG